MSLNKDRPLDERVNRNQVRDSQAQEQARLKAEAERLRAQNAGQPGYDSEGNLQTTDQLPDDTEEATPDTNLGDFQEQGGYLESKSFEIDPNKNTPTEREKQREDRLRNRAGSGQQGADIAKKKLPKSKQTDIPQFLQSTNMKESYKRDKEQYGDFDKAVEDAGKLTDIAEKIKALSDAARRHRILRDPVQQLEFISKVAAMGTAVLMGVTRSLISLPY